MKDSQKMKSKKGNARKELNKLSKHHTVYGNFAFQKCGKVKLFCSKMSACNYKRPLLKYIQIQKEDHRHDVPVSDIK